MTMKDLQIQTCNDQNHNENLRGIFKSTELLKPHNVSTKVCTIKFFREIFFSNSSDSQIDKMLFNYSKGYEEPMFYSP